MARPRTGKRPTWEESPMADEARMDDETLLAQIAAGNAAATAEFYKRWFPIFARLACKMLKDRTAADDLAQEVVILVIHKAEKFAPGRGKAKPWLMRLLFNRIH